MHDFRVYFRDGNQKLFEAENMYAVLSYIYFVLHYNASDITKIEEVDR